MNNFYRTETTRLRMVNTFLLGALGIVFIVLKLVGSIAWNWVWVLTPFWSPIGLFLVIIGVGLLLLA